MELNYKKAVLEDIEILTETRITVLRAANQLSDDMLCLMLRNNRIYIIKNLFWKITMWHTWFLMVTNLLVQVG